MILLSVCICALTLAEKYTAQKNKGNTKITHPSCEIFLLNTFFFTQLNVLTTKSHKNYQWKSNVSTHGGLDLESHSKLKWKTTLQADPTLM